MGRLQRIVGRRLLVRMFVANPGYRFHLLPVSFSSIATYLP